MAGVADAAASDLIALAAAAVEKVDVEAVRKMGLWHDTRFSIDTMLNYSKRYLLHSAGTEISVRGFEEAKSNGIHCSRHNWACFGVGARWQTRV